jgi:hypothetical protein
MAPNDNRMSWIRNLETLASGRQQYTVEYELGSECNIPGLLDYADGCSSGFPSIHEPDSQNKIRAVPAWDRCLPSSRKGQGRKC